MRVFLVRHGESVDNVAGLYAGSRDSPLTSHGVLQAQRLGAHLAARTSETGHITRVFSSDLQRAFYTAQAIIDARSPPEVDAAEVCESVQVVKVADLRERDFRLSEGKHFSSKPSSGSWENPHPDAETQEEMRVRTDRFVETHLAPILLSEDALSEGQGAIVIVAHGVILNVLLQSLLSRFAPTELVRLTGSAAGQSASLVAWRNAGYLEAEVRPIALLQPAPLDEWNYPAPEQALHRASHHDAPQYSATIQLLVTATDVVTHLQGLKKTRGSISSAPFDKKQKTMDSFFGPGTKKPKPKDDDDA